MTEGHIIRHHTPAEMVAAEQLTPAEVLTAELTRDFERAVMAAFHRATTPAEVMQATTTAAITVLAVAVRMAGKDRNSRRQAKKAAIKMLEKL